MILELEIPGRNKIFTVTVKPDDLPLSKELEEAILCLQQSNTEVNYRLVMKELGNLLIKESENKEFRGEKNS